MYARVDNLAAAVSAARDAGAQVALDAMPLGEHGTIAIVIHGGLEHGYWQVP